MSTPRKECKRSNLFLPLLSAGAAAGILLSLFIPSTSLDISKNTHFMKLDTRFILQPNAIDPALKRDSEERKTALEKADPAKYGLRDFYTISLFNSCKGGFYAEGTEERDIWRLEECGGRSLSYEFKPFEMFREAFKALTDDQRTQVLELTDSDNYIKKTWRPMVIAFSFAFIANAIVFALGLIGIVWRWGASIEAFVAFFSAVSTFVAAILSSTMFKKIQEAFIANQSVMGVRTVVSMRALGWTWFAFAFSFVSFILYLWQTSCCTSPSRYTERERESKDIEAEKGRLMPVPEDAPLPPLPRYSSATGYNKVNTLETTYGYQPARD